MSDIKAGLRLRCEISRKFAPYFGVSYEPLRQRVSKEIMLRYTTGVLAGEGLTVDLFKYLADTRVRIAANAASLEARRDFLLAVIDLQAVLTIGSEAPNSAEPAGPSPVMR